MEKTAAGSVRKRPRQSDRVACGGDVDIQRLDAGYQVADSPPYQPGFCAGVFKEASDRFDLGSFQAGSDPLYFLSTRGEILQVTS